MIWIWLLASGISEIAWATCIKHSKGFSDPAWTIAALLTTVSTVWTLGIALKGLPLSLGYAAWTGIAVIGTVTVGLVAGERINAGQLLCIALILVGAVGLKLVAPETAA
jgi:quaternary ammonium compound-resistance protein SugE